MIHRKVAMVFMTLIMAVGTVFATFTDQSIVLAAKPYADLENTINQVMSASNMKTANSSVTVRKATTGEIVYQAQSEKGITPASSLKLLTSAAALETLGEDYRFTTEVLTEGKISSGKVLYGNLYLRGTGDPTLLKKDFDSFATQLSNLGINQITGDLVGDDTYFDKVRLSPGIERMDETYSYAAQVSALSISPNGDYDAGSVIVDAKPGARNKAAIVTLTPVTDVVRVINKSKTVAKGNKNTLQIRRQYGTNNIVISGNAPLGTGGKREFIAVSNPTGYALNVFKRSLAEKGIKFSAESKVAHRKTPDTARVLSTKSSMQLKNLMTPFMKLSNNTHAEVLAKTMGKEQLGEGSWNTGLQVMRDYVKASGLDVDKWKFEDASGMSQANKVTSAQLSELLYVVQAAPWYNSFLKGLPVAGINDRFVGGTLRNRMTAAPAKGNVMAKTGSLDNVKALAGYAKTRDGETLIFSVLTQDTKSSTIPSIDRIATAISNSKK